jgi:hypothetical protein
MELAPFSAAAEEVVKASAGHYPLPFLISLSRPCRYRLKNWPAGAGWLQIYRQRSQIAKSFLNGIKKEAAEQRPPFTFILLAL